MGILGFRQTGVQPFDEHWFRRIVLRDLRPYSHVMLASLVAKQAECKEKVLQDRRAAKMTLAV